MVLLQILLTCREKQLQYLDVCLKTTSVLACYFILSCKRAFHHDADVCNSNNPSALFAFSPSFFLKATSCIKITHHFVNRILDAKLKGYIGFTSSSAGFVPNPLSAMYASTKAFLTLFATSLAPEVRSLGIDVVVVHPSPMATNFFDEASSLSALMAFKKFAAGPSVIADVLFNSAGRFVVRDQGTVSILFRLVMKAFDMNLFCELTARFAHMSGDHQKFNPGPKKE